jgi:hypothetical protein
MFGPDLVEEAELIVRSIQDNLKAPKSHQETYATKRRRPLAFKVGNHVYLRVSPMKRVKRFGVKGKLAPRYIRPFPILEKCGTMAYKLDLPPSVVGVHEVFHVSQLKKCLKALMDVVLPKVTPLEADLLYPSTQSRSWIKRIVSQGVRQSSSSRTTLKKQQHGKARIFSVLAI